MKYRMYKLSFPYGIHIGDKGLDKSLITFSADMLFSALYIEALHFQGIGMADWLLRAAKEGNLLISDAFPYIKETSFLPKPFVSINKETSGDSIQKKAFKKLLYVPMEEMKTFLSGDLDPVKTNDLIKGLGVMETKVSAAISGLEDAQPYQVGYYRFQEGNGLYFISGVNTEEDADRLNGLLRTLSFSGLGGKRKSGYGRFKIEEDTELPSEWFDEQVPGPCMSLSISLPMEDEIQAVLPSANYQVVKRGGFIQSGTYADQPMKKKDLFMISAGSCFQKRFHGDIYDVSLEGNHPVYRYGKPIFFNL